MTLVTSILIDDSDQKLTAPISFFLSPVKLTWEYGAASRWWVFLLLTKQYALAYDLTRMHKYKPTSLFLRTLYPASPYIFHLHEFSLGCRLETVVIPCQLIHWTLEIGVPTNSLLLAV